jgi:hypothetical protein
MPAMPMKSPATLSRPALVPAQPAQPISPAPASASMAMYDKVPSPGSDTTPATLPLDIEPSDGQQPQNRLPDLRTDSSLLPEFAIKLAPIQDQPEPPVLTQTYQPKTAVGGMSSALTLAHRKPEDSSQQPLTWKDSGSSNLAFQSSFGKLNMPKPATNAHVAVRRFEPPPQFSSQPAQPLERFKAGGSLPSKTVDPPPVPKPASSRRASVYENALKDNLEVVALQQDPEIEEAAISFANGDEAAAELTLLKLLGPSSCRHDEVEVWLALFDLYRAAGKYDAFNDLAPKFITLFGRSAPQWERVPNKDISSTADFASQAPHTRAITWASPSQLNADALKALTSMARHAMQPWRIDWRSIKVVEPDVLPQLNGLFTQWANMPTQLQFIGGQQLLSVLAEQSIFQNKNVNPEWWHVRMALLRLMGVADQFDQTALNYCITYEISPPAWTPPKGSYTPLDADGQPASEPTNNPSSAQQALALPTVASQPLAATGVFAAVLEGKFLGSAKSALATLPNDLERIQTIDFDCRALQRVDFDAAGELLNWSIAQQNQGRTVTFRHLHRLLASFFSVIGINATAQVVLRKD